MSNLERVPVKRVRDALSAAGLGDRVIELDASARTAADAARALDAELGAIVKSLVFAVGPRFVMALVAGDASCVEAALPKALNMQGAVRRPQASEVKAITGFAIGGVAPVGLNHPLPMVIDASLKRFTTLYAAAGHPNCVFPIAFSELAAATAGIVSYTIAVNPDGSPAFRPTPVRSKTFEKRN